MASAADNRPLLSLFMTAFASLVVFDNQFQVPRIVFPLFFGGEMTFGTLEILGGFALH
jgi:hypothetical protein